MAEPWVKELIRDTLKELAAYYLRIVIRGILSVGTSKEVLMMLHNRKTLEILDERIDWERVREAEDGS